MREVTQQSLDARASIAGDLFDAGKIAISELIRAETDAKFGSLSDGPWELRTGDSPPPLKATARKRD